ncbi:hypothetical protein ABEX29_27030 [Brevibacillus porteri]|uniref:hypothetical protein n=1 Tax=Brevibacillus porteri TaxID=2126350 RepID=UPI003D1E326A
MKKRVLTGALILFFSVVVGIGLGILIFGKHDQIAEDVYKKFEESLVYQGDTLTGTFPTVKDGYSVLLTLEDSAGRKRVLEDQDGSTFTPGMSFNLSQIPDDLRLRVQVWKTPIIEQGDKILYDTSKGTVKKEVTLAVPVLKEVGQANDKE